MSECPGHGDYTHAELLVNFGRCGGCGQPQVDLNALTRQTAEHVLWKLYHQGYISKTTWTRGTREARSKE